ncbi:MAG: hypothetical protein IJE08_08045 [Clostridia bacterium]|nr:hypothetical protein [Clostridia bacterium]
MKTQWLRPLSAAALLVLLALHPGEAAQAALQSLTMWAQSVAPSLLPFLIVIPALTGPDVSRMLSRFSGGFLHLMRLPAHSTGALLIGLLSGSPAGAAALASVRKDPSDPTGAFLRAALMASGASPAFLLGSVSSMLPEGAGPLLLSAQVSSSLLTGLLLRRFGSDHPVPLSAPARPRGGAVLSAALTLLAIAGYMALFSVIARLLCLYLGPDAETPLLAALELAGGCSALASLPAPAPVKLPVIAAAACFGGVSVYAQCMSFLRPLGIDSIEYAVGKLVQAALCAVIACVQAELAARFTARVIVLLPLSLVLSSALLSLRFRSPESSMPLSEKRAA